MNDFLFALYYVLSDCSEKVFYDVENDVSFVFAICRKIRTRRHTFAKRVFRVDLDGRRFFPFLVQFFTCTTAHMCLCSSTLLFASDRMEAAIAKYIAAMIAYILEKHFLFYIFSICLFFTVSFLANTLLLPSWSPRRTWPPGSATRTQTWSV